MIRELTDVLFPEIIYALECDSCYERIATCTNFVFLKNQKLVYSPLLCELCGRIQNKDTGDKVAKIESLEKQLLENLKK